MVIDLTPEQEALILDAARAEGKSVGEFITEAVRWVAQNEEADRASVRRGMEQMERGEFIEHSEMELRVARMFKR
jgi:predicted transcriptional regulator